MADEKTPEIVAAEKRGYSKGYQAGKRRAEREDGLAEIAAKREAFRQQCFLAALNGTLIVNTWKTGDKHWTSPQDYSRGCWNFADEAIKGTFF